MMLSHEAELSCRCSRSRSATCAASSSCNDSSKPRAARAVSESLRPSRSSLATISSCRETCFWLSATCRSTNFRRCSITARFIHCYSGSRRLQKVYPSTKNLSFRCNVSRAGRSCSELSTSAPTWRSSQALPTSPGYCDLNDSSGQALNPRCINPRRQASSEKRIATIVSTIFFRSIAYLSFGTSLRLALQL